MVEIDREIVEVCRHFNIKGEPVSQGVFTDGHINSTMLFEFNEDGEIKKYLIQGINTHVFKNPEELMSNVIGVSEYLGRMVEERGGNRRREFILINIYVGDVYPPLLHY